MNRYGRLTTAALFLVAIVTANACSSSGTHRATSATEADRSEHEEELRPNAPLEHEEEEGEPAGDPDKKRMVPPRSKNDHSLTALPTPAVAGPAWQFLGPQPILNLQNYVTSPPQRWGKNSGRITALQVHPTTPLTIYAGSAGGGVWKTTDGGINWTSKSDNEASLAIGALAMDATGSTIYAGTGEQNFNADSIPGQGILKSTDGGTTWTLLGRTTFGNHTIGGIAIDRQTSGATTRILVASDLGLFISNDAGQTWGAANAPFSAAAGTTSAAMQIIQDPKTPSEFWATSGAITTCGGTFDARVLRSHDSGVTWTASYSPANANRIALAVGKTLSYAAVSDCSGNLSTVMRTTNAGVSWAATAAQPTDYMTGQGWYNNVAAVDPTNNNRLIVAGTGAYVTPDGGATWTDTAKLYAGGVVHPDFHAAVFTGARSLMVGNDGGVWSTRNFGGSWTNRNSDLAIAQFYRGDAPDLNHVVGGLQDNGAAGYMGTKTLAWSMYGPGGDGGFAAIDPTTGSSTVYSEAQNLGLTQVTGGAKTPGIAADPCGGGCTSSAFVAPVVMDPAEPKRLLAATTAVFESRKGATYTGGIPAGANGWTQISPVLATGSDRIIDLVVGPRGETGVIWAVTQSGQLWRTTDALGASRLPNGFSTWKKVTGDLPNVGTRYGGIYFISAVAFNPWNIDEAWVTTTYTGAGTSLIWHTTNVQATSPHWANLSGSLSAKPGSALAVDPRDPRIVYLGTDTGVYQCTLCAGTNPAPNWQRWGTALPNVWVNQLTFTRDHSSLVAWTHGRGVWALATPDVPTTNPITEFPVAGASLLQGMTAGPNGPWYVDAGTGSIGHADALGAVTSFTVGTPSDGLAAVVAGPDGNLWYTATNASYIGVVKPDGTGGQHYPLAAGARPIGITVGPDLNLWIVTNAQDAVQQFDPFARTLGLINGTPSHGSRPRFIATGADGNLWITEYATVKVTKMTTAGVYTEFDAPNPTGAIGGPYGITRGPDGNIWFTNYSTNKVVQITPSGAMQSVSVGAGVHGPVDITTGYDGALWATDASAQNIIVRIDPVLLTTKTYTIPTANSNSWGIAPGPDGNLWFTEAGTGKIARMQLSQA